MLTLRSQHCSDDLLRCLLAEINGVAIGAGSQEQGAVEIFSCDPERVRDQSSALINQDPLARDDIRDGVDGAEIVAKLAGSARDHVGVDSGAFLESPRGERVELAFIGAVGDDNQEVPITAGARVAPGAATEEPDLLGVIFFLDPRQEHPDGDEIGDRPPGITEGASDS